jgi:hypothetical protein
MRSKTNHFIWLVANFLLWIAGIFFLLGAISFIAKSFPAAIAMLALSLLLMPLTWRKIRKLNPKAFGWLSRFGLVSVTFIAAVALTPPQTPEPASSQKPVVADTAATTKTQSPAPLPANKAAVTNKAEDITDVFVEGESYKVSGTGAANTDYTIKLPDDLEQKVKTVSNGEFTLTLPKNASVFGSMELVRDTNGWWFGGEKTVAKAYYALDKDNTQHSGSPLKPIIFGVSDKAPYEISGTYTPGTQIVVKSGSKDLAKAKVDKTGRFKFTNVSLSTNFTSVAIYQRTSTGWFSSKDTKVSDDKYVDTQAYKLLAELPVYTKEVTVSQSVPFTEQTIESGSLNKGETKVTQEGVNGSKDIIYVVTYKGNKEIGRQQKSEVITKQPVVKVITLGTYVAPPVYVAPQTTVAPDTSSGGRTGATCNDGSHSSATGKGACSHHGGVAVWLY